MPRGTSQYDAAIIERRLWTPQVVPTDVWYDASDYSTLVFDARVTTWKDKSGNNKQLDQVTVGKQPDWVENSFNTKPSIKFDGINDELVAATATTYSTSHTFIWAGQIVGPLDNSQAYFHGDGTLDGPNTYTAGLWWYTAANGDIVSFIGGVDNNPTIISLTRINADWGMNVRGSPQTVNFQFNYTGNFKSFGAAFTDFSDMRVAEFFMYPQGKESWIIAKAEGYIAHKWNMRDGMSINHQYKNKPALRGAG